MAEFIHHNDGDPTNNSLDNLSVLRWAPPRLVVAELPDWKLEDAVAVGISIVPLDMRDFKVVCGELAVRELTNEQRLFLLRLAVAPDESANG